VNINASNLNNVQAAQLTPSQIKRWAIEHPQEAQQAAIAAGLAVQAIVLQAAIDIVNDFEKKGDPGLHPLEYLHQSLELLFGATMQLLLPYLPANAAPIIQAGKKAAQQLANNYLTKH
jgi:hypothetical protein